MKITTWNVNGLRAVLNRNAFGWVETISPDIVCLQEIKARPEQLKPDDFATFKSFYPFWNPAERPGYSGVATFSKNQPETVQLGIDHPRFDGEGRVILTRHPGFLLFNIYFPNGQRDLTRLEYKLDFYAALLKLVDDLQASGEAVVICGDFNTAHKEIDLRNPKQNEKTSGFLPEERAWIDEYLAHGLVDAFRHLYPDREQYTWWTYRFRARERNIGWRLDYFLISQCLVNHVQDVIVHEDIPGSDHCPVSLILEDGISEQ